jgi:protein-L-isoaspartate(D-aspartate) O-methyltransferase
MSTPEQAQQPRTHDQFIEEHIASLPLSPRVIDAFRSVDRGLFVPEEELDNAYTDRIVNIKEGSSVSQPTLVAQMTEILDIQPSDTVLEVGTASGYQAAVLSRLASEVHTVEYDEELAESARARLSGLGYDNVHVHGGDGAAGLPERRPFDRIIVTAALRDKPTTLLDQLEIGGRLIAPIGPDPDNCTMTLFIREGEAEDEYRTIGLGPCYFVPLMSSEEGGWTEEALEELENTKRIKTREDLKLWLTAFYEHNGYKYDELFTVLSERMHKIIDNENVALSEDQVLDIVDLVAMTLPHTTAATNGTAPSETPAEIASEPTAEV